MKSKKTEEVNLENIAQYVFDLKDNLKINQLDPVADILALVNQAKIKYTEDSFGNNFSAFSCSLGQQEYLICFNIDHHWNENYKRFSIAHELGHIFIPSHRNILDSEGKHFSSAEFRISTPIEREADQFSIDFLAPKRTFKLMSKNVDFDRNTISLMSDYFKISQYACALRYAQTTDDACVLIVSDAEGYIEYECRSQRFYENSSGVHSISRQNMDKNTLTYSVLKMNESRLTQTSKLSSWYPEVNDNLLCKESIIRLDYCNKTLTLLTPYSNDLYPYIKKY